jgi:hypothetical protein
MAAELPMLESALPTAIALALGAIGVLSRETAATVAIAVGVATLFLWGLVVARASGLPWARSLTRATISGGFGLLIVALKVVVH